MRACQTAGGMAGKRATRNAAMVGHGPSGSTMLLGPTPFRVGGGAGTGEEEGGDGFTNQFFGRDGADEQDVAGR